MSRLIASNNALRALLLLSQRAGGMRTSEVADALEISYTGAEKALDILVADGLAGCSERRYALTAPRPGSGPLRLGLPANRYDARIARARQ